MKTIRLLLLTLLIVSCSSEDEDCNCIKQTYIYDQVAVIGSNGLPTLQFTKVVLSQEQVTCQPEQTEVELTNGELFDIICD